MIYDISVYSINKALEARRLAQKKDKTFVLTNGCFDILHAGHVVSLKHAAALGDFLWVGMNSDTSVKNNKGNNRPIISETHRAYLLSSLQFVSGVFIFNNSNLANEIKILKPDIYAKAEDYSIDSINSEEREALEKTKAKIKFVPILEGVSTTSIINKIRNDL